MPEITKTRLAPTPSGHLHLGNAFSFCLTYLFAKLNGHNILLRIDDADQARYRPEYAESIFKTLEALGITWDEGPQTVKDLESQWSQKYREPLYQNYLQKLEARQLLFACTCSRKKLAFTALEGYPGFCIDKEVKAKNEAVALRWQGTPQQVKMLNLSGMAQFYPWPAPMNHFVVRQKNGQVSYQLASLADDVHFGVTHLIRGKDLLPSSLAQVVLANALNLNFNQAHFLHHDLVKVKGQKLSKSQAAAPVLEQLEASGGSQAFFYQLSQWLSFKAQYPNLPRMLGALQAGGV